MLTTSHNFATVHAPLFICTSSYSKIWIIFSGWKYIPTSYVIIYIIYVYVYVTWPVDGKYFGICPTLSLEQSTTHSQWGKLILLSKHALLQPIIPKSHILTLWLCATSSEIRWACTA